MNSPASSSPPAGAALSTFGLRSYLIQPVLLLAPTLRSPLRW